MGNTKRFVWTCLVLALSGIGAAALAQTAFPLLPSMSVDPDGTLHWSEPQHPAPGIGKRRGAQAVCRDPRSFARRQV